MAQTKEVCICNEKIFMIRKLLTGGCLALSIAAFAQSEKDRFEDSAVKYFTEVQERLAGPEANLWTYSLAGPMIFVDRKSRKVYANLQDKEGFLTRSGEIWTGNLPLDINIANTATIWAGLKWTMVQLPLPADPKKRMSLLFHEMFHRIQDEIGLPANSPVCEHLDSREGRIYFRLELEALKAAISKPVHQRRKDLEAALAFRQYRYHLYSNASQIEQQLEFNEGLAEFTGVYVSGICRSDPQYLEHVISDAVMNYKSFARSMAYITGPVYGILLSQKNKRWQLQIRSASVFGELLAENYHLKKGTDRKDQIQVLMKQYNGDSIVREESDREKDRLNKEIKYTATFVNGHLLELPHTSLNNFSFDPNNIFPFGENSAIYHTMTMTDKWGRLVVTDAAWMKNFSKTYVPVPDSMHVEGPLISGPGWELELNKNWKLAAGAKTGDFKVVEK